MSLTIRHTTPAPEHDECGGWTHPPPASVTQIEQGHITYEDDAVSGHADGVTRLERALGRRWTAEDTQRVLDRMDREISTLGPDVVSLYETQFLEVITDPEYEHVWASAIRLDIEYLRAGGSAMDESSEGLVSDIWEEVERYLDSGVSDVEIEEETMVRGLTEEAIERGVKRKRGCGCGCGGTEKMCVVCQETFGEEAVAGLGCGHEYHLDCIKMWLRESNVCPLCKARVLEEEEEEDV